MKTLLFSDVHLKAARADRPRHAEFIRFLRGFDPAEYRRVVCLGDLFDFWFEYRHVIFSAYFDVLRVFAEWRDAGVELHLVCGNHDFWAGRFLREDLGFQIHPTSVELPFGAGTAHVVHGDGINPEDWRYRAYKRVARNPWVVGAFRMIHPDLAMKIAQGVSHGSRTVFGRPDPEHGPEATALRRYARRHFEGGGAAGTVICGHAHAPTHEWHVHAGGRGEYINMGDWLQHRCHLVHDEAGFHLFDRGELVKAVELRESLHE